MKTCSIWPGDLRTALGMLLAAATLLAACTTPPASPGETATPTHLPTLPAAATATPVATPDPATMEVTTSSTLSPDGRWEAVQTVAIPKNGASYYSNLTVTERAGNLRWAVVDAWAPFGLGYTVPRPFQWSRDGRSLFVTNDPAPDGCALFVNGTDLARVDLATGAVTQLVEPVGLWLSLSPDETKLVYLSWGEDRPLVVRDLASGAEQAIVLPTSDPNWQAGNIVWSPEGDQVLVTIANAPCEGGWAKSTSIVQVTLDAPQAKLLLESDERLLVTTGWPEPSTILLADQDGQTIEMNAATGQIEQEATGTLQGNVAIGPLQPVVRVDEPTPEVPPEVYAARQIVVHAADGLAEIARVPIGPDGSYSVDLPPGDYVIDINRVGIDFSKDVPAKVHIEAGQTVTLDVAIDTGIR